MTYTDPLRGLFDSLPEDLKSAKFDQAAAATQIGNMLTGMHEISRDPIRQPTQTPTTAAEPAPTDTAAASPTGVGHPYEGDQPAIASGYGPRGGGVHQGIDFSVPVGSHMLAAIGGTVTHAAGDDPGGYGNWVEITGANGLSVRYGHLSTIGVAPGDTVTAGQVIGNSGGVAGAPGSGNSEGPHLHFEIRQNGNPVDPAPFLAGGAAIVAGGPASSPTPVSPEQIVAAQLGNTLDILKRQPPTQDAQPKPATQKTQTARVPGDTSGDWATDILNGIGAPVTDENRRAMDAWMRAEGGAVHNNPLNTTQEAPGATNWNSIGVKTYVDYEQGLTSTIRTLLNGRYGNVISALRAGNNAHAVGQAVAQSPWGTGEGLLRLLGG